MERKEKGYWNTFEHCLKETMNYKNLTQLKIHSHGCYCSIKKHHWEKLVFNEIKNQEQMPQFYWNIKENCLKTAKKFKTVYELERNNYGCYMGMKRNKWLQETFPNSFKNKESCYWNNKENVLNEAKKYKTKVEFKNNCKSGYNAMYRLGIASECNKFFIKKKLYNNMDDKIHCVYVYEIPQFKTCYVGRTVNLHNRNLSHRRMVKHKDGRIMSDTLYIFCKDNNINIPNPIVKEKCLNAEESLIQEDIWLQKYISDGWKVLNKAKTGLNSGSLGGVLIWAKDKCKEVCKRFKYKTDIKKFNYQCYAECLKHNWFEEFGIQKDKRHSRFYWKNKDNCFNEMKNYFSKEDFIIYSQTAYNSILENGWKNEFEEYWKKRKGLLG